MDFVDVVVVGAGPCGLAAAISAMRAGLTVAVVDKGPVCATITEYPTYATFFSTAEKLSVGGLPFLLAETKPTRKDALAYYRGVVRHFGIPLRQFETVTAIEGAAPQLVVRSRRRTGEERALRCRAVIVATGYFGTPNCWAFRANRCRTCRTSTTRRTRRSSRTRSSSAAGTRPPRQRSICGGRGRA